ncbi:MAG: hypothetical protein ACTSXJ_00295 [Candidatus Baldrarchaeia archaeon]
MSFIIKKLKKFVSKKPTEGQETQEVPIQPPPTRTPPLPEVKEIKPQPAPPTIEIPAYVPVIRRYTLKGRLNMLLNTPEVLFKFRDSEIAIQMLVGGTPIYIKTFEHHGQKIFKVEEGRISNPDIFIKMSEDFAGMLADAQSLIEMVNMIKEEMKKDEYTRRIKIHLLKGLDDLRKKGYFNIDLFKVLVIS